MRRLAIAAAVLVTLTGAPSAAAKACIRIKAPAAVATGKAVRVTVRMYLPTWVNGQVSRLEPMPIGSGMRVTLQAEGPHGEWIRIPTRLFGRGEIRVGRVVFPTRGVWRLTAIAWEQAPRSCAPPALVRVR